MLTINIIDGKQYDIIVCGSGSAGFCAAIQGARAGMKTAIVEKYGMAGGVLTVMGNNSIDQFNNPFRPSHKMVIQGIGWEFAKELSDLGYATIPDMNAEYKYHWQYGVKVNPVAAAKLMDDYFIRENIDVYYNQPAVAVETSLSDEGAHLDSVVLSTKSGLKRLTAKVFIDCTGDGDICAWAGAPYECGDEDSGELQPGTIRYYLESNQLKQEDIPKANNTLTEAKNQGYISSEDLFKNTIADIIGTRGDNLNHIPHFNSADSDSSTIAQMESRRSMLRVMDVFQKGNIPMEIVASAPEVAPRESRRILCDSYINCEDYMSGKVFADSICYSFWFVDVHRYGQDAQIVYLTDGQTPTIRLSAMVPQGLSNVYVAGRCISGDRFANSAFRVKATCMAMGQAAGAAAAVAILSNNGKSRSSDINEIKQLLAQNGAIVPGLTEPREF